MELDTSEDRRIHPAHVSLVITKPDDGYIYKSKGRTYYLKLGVMDLSKIHTCEELMEEKIMSVFTDAYEIVTYDKIPEIFITLDEWPTKTNLLCWNCSRSFDCRPVFIPTEIKIIMKDDYRNVREIKNGYLEFKVYGNYCSFNCAAAYINRHYSGENKERLMKNLLKLACLFTGKNITYIREAFDITMCKRYGGIYTEEQYNTFMAGINPCKMVTAASDINMLPDAQREVDNTPIVWSLCFGK